VIVYDLRCEITTNTLTAGTLGRGVYSASLSATAGNVANISTRLPIGSGDDVLITGFIITGDASATKKVLVRGIGPSLTAKGVTGALADPQLTLNDSTGTAIARNDNWKQTDIFGVITADQSGDIQATGAQPTDDKEAALIATLKPSNYTAVVRGVGGGTGIGLAEAYDIDAASTAKVANVSTRGFVQTGDNIMIGGFITITNPVKVVVRAIGPSLAQFGIANPLADPTLELRDGQGTLVGSNDNWKVNDQTGQSQEADIRATQLQPNNDAESAMVQTLQPGAYTAQVRGKNSTTGIGLVEVYALP